MSGGLTVALTVSPVSSACCCPQSLHVHRQPEDSGRGPGGHGTVGYHHHDHEERPQVPAVVARLDARTPRLRLLVHSRVVGEAMRFFFPPCAVCVWAGLRQ